MPPDDVEPRSLPAPTTAEWRVLWHHHHLAELEAANKQNYDDAKHHKERADEIERFLCPADEWERAWGQRRDGK